MNSKRIKIKGVEVCLQIGNGLLGQQLSPSRGSNLEQAAGGSQGFQKKKTFNGSERESSFDLGLPPFNKDSTSQIKNSSSLRRSCNCKNSKCLKLYCECFSTGEYCKNCNCIGCHNNIEYESVRKEAIAMILERNQFAFRPKIQAPTRPIASVFDNTQIVPTSNPGVRHSKGCACK
jgi:hypothetical protein